MKRLFLLLCFLFPAALLSPVSLRAQQVETTDSVIFRPAAVVDSTLQGRSIFSLMPARSRGGAADVHVHQSASLTASFHDYVTGNARRKLTGWRVRIYFGSSQYARGESEAVAARFRSAYPGHGVYRSFSTPNYKVTVGDFRSKSEALELLERIRFDFPKAFVVKEPIHYPVVDRAHAYVADTVRVNHIVSGSL